MRRWGSTVFVLVVAVGVVAVDVAAGSLGTAVVTAVVLVAVAWVVSPVMAPHSVSVAEAKRDAAVDGCPVVYWRPGCLYCIRLRLRLGRAASRLHWVDIWKDADAAAAVRSVTGGDETVPTLVAEAREVVNPDPRWVRQLVATGGP